MTQNKKTYQFCTMSEQSFDKIKQNLNRYLMNAFVIEKKINHNLCVYYTTNNDKQNKITAIKECVASINEILDNNEIKIKLIDVSYYTINVELENVFTGNKGEK